MTQQVSITETMSRPSKAQTALQKACDAVGGQKVLAALIGTTQSMVWYWLARAKRGVPGEFVLQVEAATGGRISRHDCDRISIRARHPLRVRYLPHHHTSPNRERCDECSASRFRFT